eukprot:CAMPEP_0197183588 /NCGR_PEP_ID=MMETSP1423-20130617/7897_1 /TAXON_ID=476441 /ORGANISM="Pseudo-nitzschia heimii, Strain UNC1101" /LENGTH=1051 /DNA_ID=CAMNT_0042634177 /DNA_START=135 /DNA_END=3290 /DNA_ORIENTATION=+
MTAAEAEEIDASLTSENLKKIRWSSLRGGNGNGMSGKGNNNNNKSKSFRSVSLKPTEAMSLSLTGDQRSSTLSGSTNAVDENDVRSARTVRRLKTAIVSFFLVTALGVAAAFSVYSESAKIADRERFVERFEQDATSMLAMLGIAIDATLASTDAFAVSMLAEAKATDQTWPFVTIDDYNVQATKLLKNAGAKFVTTYAVVEEDQREEWESYASNHTGWVEQSLEVQARNRGYSGPNVTDEYLTDNYMGHYDQIHGYDEFFFCGNSTDGVDHGGPYVPMWQHTPVIPVYPLYNWDLSTAVFRPPWYAVYDTHLVTITEPYMIAWPWDADKIAENEAEAEWIQVLLEPGEEPLEPISDIYYPVIAEALTNVYHRAEDPLSEGYSTESNHLGAYVGLTIYWRDTLRDLLPVGSAGVAVVFENACDVPPFAYEITGPLPRYLGAGYYNSTFEDDPELTKELDLMDVWHFAIKETSYTGIPINENVCPFRLKVYPAESSRSAMDDGTKSAVYVVLVLVLSVAILAVLFTLLFFFLYDRLVRNEIQAKINLLDAKRNFVRFVSHEVRTPLNTVSMGLALIHQDLDGRKKRAAAAARVPTGDENDGDGETDRLLGTVAVNGGDDGSSVVLTGEELERLRSLTGDVSSNAEIAVGVLNDLLNIDKIQMGVFRLEMGILPIWSIVEETTAEFQMMAAKQKTDLRLDFSGLAEARSIDEGGALHPSASDLPASVRNQKLVGDSPRLRQVLRNLLSNAVKFSKDRSVTVRAGLRDDFSPISKDASAWKEFRLAAEGDRTVRLRMSGRVVVDVVDTGVGMTPAQLQTVFDVGTQFNASKLQSGGGSGLGLAFAKAITEQHGGSLRAFSDGRDRGTTFRLDLPLFFDEEHDDDDIDDAQGEERHPSSSRKSSGGGATEKSASLEPMRILVVDDAPLNRKLLMRLLEGNGHSCVGAENGQALIDEVRIDLEGGDGDDDDDSDQRRRRPYDCILVDYEMPVMNGPDACRAIRKMGYVGFVVGVTGNLLPEDVGHFMDCGADAVLPKPFRYGELEQLLMEHGLFAV